MGGEAGRSVLSLWTQQWLCVAAPSASQGRCWVGKRFVWYWGFFPPPAHEEVRTKKHISRNILGCPAPEGHGGPLFTQRKSRLPHPTCGVGLLPARITFAWSLLPVVTYVFLWFLLGVAWSRGVRAPGPHVACLHSCPYRVRTVCTWRCQRWLAVPYAEGCQVMNRECYSCIGEQGRLYKLEPAVFVAKEEEGCQAQLNERCLVIFNTGAVLSGTAGALDSAPPSPCCSAWYVPRFKTPEQACYGCRQASDSLC